ncbi:MAG: hypothetical protein LC732_11805 [Acidobacteria bacterium]|nr:hypothetical protein [Acidobacteriota bacterium]
MKYSQKFRSKMVGRMTAPGGRSANALSAEVGVAQGTLSRWLRDASSVGGMKSKRSPSAKPHPKHRSPQDKLRLIIEAAALSGDELGEFLRREGIHEADLTRWRESSLEGLSGKVTAAATANATDKRVRDLEKELRRKDKALAETAALLVLQKKVQAIWGDGGDDT